MNTVQQSSINPAFAGYAARHLREASDDLQRVFDNLLEIAGGDVPDATGYDQIRATRILYDRGFGKITRNTPQAPAPESARPPESGESHNPTNHSSDNSQPEPAKACPEPSRRAGPEPESQPEACPEPSRRAPLERGAEQPKGLVSQIEQKLDDLLGPPQAPESSRTRTPTEIAQGFVPDIVRDSQYYVLEITDYGAKLAAILMSIHEPDPENDTIRQCHRVTAGQMIIDRVLGPASSLQYDSGYTYDPEEDPYWAFRHPAEVDSQLTPEELKEADRLTRNFVKGMKQEDDGTCDDCTDDYLCEYHDPDGEFYEDANISEEEIDILARAMKNLAANRDRLYMDRQDGRLKLRPRDYIDDS